MHSVKKKWKRQREKIYIKTPDISTRRGNQDEEGSFSKAAVNEPACLSDWLQNSLTVDSTQKSQRFFS